VIIETFDYAVKHNVNLRTAGLAKAISSIAEKIKLL